MSSDRPWVKWYWRDWRGDQQLRACSLPARGLWAEMLALMHEAEPYGHLVINGRPVDASLLARLVSSRSESVQKYLQELYENGVYSVTAEGLIFSRRMVKDRRKTVESIEHGRKGGNPALRLVDKGRVNPQDKPSRARVPEARGQRPDKDPSFGLYEDPQRASQTLASPAAPVLEFPTKSAGSERWALTELQLTEWRTAFPALDVMAEMRKALAWLNANPTKRKTSRGMPKFFVGWLTKAADSSRTGARSAPVTGRADVPGVEETRRFLQERRDSRRTNNATVRS